MTDHNSLLFKVCVNYSNPNVDIFINNIISPTKWVQFFFISENPASRKGEYANMEESRTGQGQC